MHLQDSVPLFVSPLRAMYQKHRDNGLWTLLEAAQVLLCSGWQKEAVRHQQHPQEFSASFFPQTRRLLLIANVAGCKYTGLSIQELTLSEVKWVWIRLSALNQIACEASSPQGRRGRRREKRGAKQKHVLLVIFDSSQWSLITDWQGSC